MYPSVRLKIYCRKLFNPTGAYVLACPLILVVQLFVAFMTPRKKDIKVCPECRNKTSVVGGRRIYEKKV